MSQIAIWGWDEANKEWVKVLVDDDGHLKVDVVSSAKPTNVATAANQVTIIGHVDGIEALLAGGLPVALAALGGLKVVNLFGGSIYVNSDTASTDAARRFETTSKKLRDVIITVGTKAQFFGDSSNQTYRVLVGEAIGFTKVDISTLYFKNYASGQHGTVHILGVEE